SASTGVRMQGSEPPDLEGARETARRAIRDGHRAADVIARLRALFVKDRAITDLLDLNEATREVIDLSLHEIQRRQVVLRTELAKDLPRVSGDRVQLQQVIVNLILNALAAMETVHDRPRQLVISTELDERDHVRLSVADSGVGFEPRDADQLFEAFYTTKAEGMGIGLFVSRTIIDTHGGSIWAAPNDAAGATFSFSLPRCREAW